MGLLHSIRSEDFASYSSAEITVVERRLRNLDLRNWDDFAMSCTASFHSSLRYLRVWAAITIFEHRLRVFELFSAEEGSRRKIGQCVVAVSRLGGAHSFVDGLNLSSSDTHRWPEAMAAVLGVVGPGEFSYGWVWAIEPRREAELGGLKGVNVKSVRPVVVHAVDFSRWDSWASYFSAISENSRRNAKAALKNFPDLRLDVRSGIAAIPHVGQVALMTAAMARRKGLQSRGRSVARYIVGILSGGRRCTLALATAGGRALSAYYGVGFGDQTYYLEGGSDEKSGGAAWHLMIRMLQRAYEAHPRGRFVMGYVDYEIHRDEIGSGLLRSRNACRVEEHETTIVRFDYAR